MSAFHFAFNVSDLDEARRFYGGLLGCTEGRSTETWVDFDFFGNQISLHLGPVTPTADTGHVGEHLVPMPHFGAVLTRPDWEALAARLTGAQTPFVIPPQVRFEGQPGEQHILFLRDPFGNALEFKGFDDAAGVFAA